jgi:DNA-binding XRE family transcriptional regulator
MHAKGPLAAGRTAADPSRRGRPSPSRGRASSEHTQAEAAAHLGVAQTAIAKLEAGTRSLTLLEAVDLADFYGVALLDFGPRVLDGKDPARAL